MRTMIRFGVITILFVEVLFSLKSFAQQDMCIITFKIDSNYEKNIRNLRINVFQNKKLLVCKVDEPIWLYKGIDLTIEFDGLNFLLPGIKNLKVYRDTTILILSNSMIPVVVKAKKRIVRQTLLGFDYYPSNDSIFKNQSILLALQRLPFIKVVDNEIEYKNQQKILFQINGKERKGIGNNWSDILKVIKAKDIYKVEMINEISVLVRNQGYDVIINILTEDANIYGKSINAVLLLDQRENLNKNAGITTLRRRTDFSFKLSNNNDNQILKKENKVLESGEIISYNKLNLVYQYHFLGFYADYGLRIDSSKDFSINASCKYLKNSTKHNNDYNFPTLFNNQKNSIKGNSGQLNASYIYKKSKILTHSVAMAINLDMREFENRISFIDTYFTDSICNIAQTNPYSYIIEYNVNENRSSKKKFEYGVQAYGKLIFQDYSKYAVDRITNKKKYLLYENNDSLFLRQYSFRPYFKILKNLSDRSSLVLIANTEFYFIKNKNRKLVNYFLPTFNIKLKELLKENTSITYNLELNFSKPSTDLFMPVQITVNPIENRIGSPNLIPGKSLSFSIDLTQVRKTTISHTVKLNYSFDVINYFTVYDTSTHRLFSKPDNGGRELSAEYSIYIQRQLSKNIQFSATGWWSYVISQNKIFNTRYKGFQFGGSNNISFFIGPKSGSVGVISRLMSNNITNQGYYRGSMKYAVYYSKIFFKRKLITTLTANEFLFKNRTINAFTQYGNFKNYSYSNEPYRLFSIRLAYNFSTIRVSKVARRKSTGIQNELPEVL